LYLFNHLIIAGEYISIYIIYKDVWMFFAVCLFVLLVCVGVLMLAINYNII